MQSRFVTAEQRLPSTYYGLWIFESVPCFSADVVMVIVSYLDRPKPLSPTLHETLLTVTAYLKKGADDNYSPHNHPTLDKTTGFWQWGLYEQTHKIVLKPPPQLWRNVMLERMQRLGEPLRKRIAEHKQNKGLSKKIKFADPEAEHIPKEVVQQVLAPLMSKPTAVLMFMTTTGVFEQA